MEDFTQRQAVTHADDNACDEWAALLKRPAIFKPRLNERLSEPEVWEPTK